MKSQTFTDPVTNQTHELTFEPNQYRASVGKWWIDGNESALLDFAAEQEEGDENYRIFGPPPGEAGVLIHMRNAVYTNFLAAMDGSVIQDNERREEVDAEETGEDEENPSGE